MRALAASSNAPVHTALSEPRSIAAINLATSDMIPSIYQTVVNKTGTIMAAPPSANARNAFHPGNGFVGSAVPLRRRIINAARPATTMKAPASYRPTLSGLFWKLAKTPPIAPNPSTHKSHPSFAVRRLQSIGSIPTSNNVITHTARAGSTIAVRKSLAFMTLPVRRICTILRLSGGSVNHQPG
jgi:hypothetical protein